MKMNKIFCLILAVMCLTLMLFACKDKDKTSGSTKGSSTVQSSNSAPSGKPDNQNPTPPPMVDEECEHIWSNVSVDFETESTSSVYLKGKCYLCTDSLSKEVITTVTYEEWNKALSLEGMGGFTEIIGNEHTNYGENGSFAWRVNDGIATEEYFINFENETSEYYVTEKLSGYKRMYGNFTYDNEKKSYVLKISDTVSIEIMFYDGNLLSISTVSSENHITRSTTYYVNQGKINVSVPTYFFERFNQMISADSINSSKISSIDAEKIITLLASLSFDGKYEIAYAENGGVAVAFYFDENLTDPINGGEYKEISIVSKDEKITKLVIGNNTIDFTY